MRKLLICFQNFSTCENCAKHWKRDIITTFGNIAFGYGIYPYLVPYPVLWWIFNIFYIYSMADHFWMLWMLWMPPLPIFMSIIWKFFTCGENSANLMLHQWMELSEKENFLGHCDHHGEGWFIKRRKEMIEKRKEERFEMHNEKKKKIILETQKDEKNVALIQKKLSKEEELKKSLSEKTEKMKKLDEMFDDLSSSKAKEMAKLVSEETNAEENMSAFCRKRKTIREELARLELESKVVAKNIVESETNRSKLAKKRHKVEARTEESLYEKKIDKAKLLDAIQKIRFELSRVHGDDEKERDSIEDKEEKSDKKSERTQELATEIEEKERDLECPVCFELCTKPIFMCHLSHQICKQCQPKMKVCPQCREPYKKHKKRHKVKEMTSEQLQLLYKNMEQLLESS